jgi:hypothetical protein
MKYTIIIIAALAAIYAGCGESSNPSNNNTTGTFNGRYALLLEPGGGGTPIDSIILNVYGNGWISTFAVTINDINNNPIVATISGTINNDTVINLTCNINYLNTNFINIATGNMIDSNGYHYMHGTIKLFNLTIGYFNYDLPITPNSYGSFNTPKINLFFRIRKLN